MSYKFTITEYTFREPNAISEVEYLEIKRKLAEDSNFTMVDSTETVQSNFEKLFRFLKGALISLPLCLILIAMKESKEDNWFLLLSIIVTGLWTIGGVLLLLQSATDLSTYSKYLKEKKYYFRFMEQSIRSSKDYHEFFDKFY